MLRLFLVVAVVASAHGQCNNDVAVANGNFEQSGERPTPLVARLLTNPNRHASTPSASL